MRSMVPINITRAINSAINDVERQPRSSPSHSSVVQGLKSRNVGTWDGGGSKGAHGWPIPSAVRQGRACLEGVLRLHSAPPAGCSMLQSKNCLKRLHSSEEDPCGRETRECSGNCSTNQSGPSVDQRASRERIMEVDSLTSHP